MRLASKKLCENLQNCLPSSSFFLFHGIKSKCRGITFQSASNNWQIDPQEVPFTDNYDIATHRFKSIVDEYVANLTATSEEIIETDKGSEEKPLVDWKTKIASNTFKFR